LGPVLFCLLMDGRRGMAKLFADYVATLRRTRSAAATRDEIATAPAAAALEATEPAKSRSAKRRAPLSRFLGTVSDDSKPR